jgi:hypothetical protein
VRSYRNRLAAYAVAGELEIWYEMITSAELLDLFEPEERELAAARLERRAQRRGHAGAARKLTERVAGRTRIVEDPPIRVRLGDLASANTALVAEVVQAYRDSLPYERRYLIDRFTFVEVVRQVVGPSVYEPYLGRSPAASHGERVVRGKRLIQAASDIFLGWTSAQDMDFYVRQFRDMKIIPDGQTIAPLLVEFAEQCGTVLARAHARSGDALALAAYVGKGRRFDEAMVAFAMDYADQTATDHAQLADAVGSGAVPGSPR